MEAVGVVNVGGGECGIIETCWFEHIKNRFVGLRDNVTDMLHQNMFHLYSNLNLEIHIDVQIFV